MKKEYTEEFDEISGFGGEYEQACRTMVLTGIEFCENNKIESKDLEAQFLKDGFGLIRPENDLTEKVMKAMADCLGEEPPTVAMMQACFIHLHFIMANGWESYKNKMKKE